MLLLVEQVDEEIAQEKLVEQAEKKAAALAAKALQKQLKELTNSQAAQRPSACCTPVFTVPGTGVFQVELETPHSLSLASSSANTSMTSVFDSSTWESSTWDSFSPNLSSHSSFAHMPLTGSTSFSCGAAVPMTLPVALPGIDYNAEPSSLPNHRPINKKARVEASNAQKID